MNIYQTKKKKSKKKKTRLDSRYITIEDQENIVKYMFSSDPEFRRLGWMLLYKTYSYEWISCKYWFQHHWRGHFQSAFHLQEIPFYLWIRLKAQSICDHNKWKRKIGIEIENEDLQWLFKKLRNYGKIWKKSNKK